MSQTDNTVEIPAATGEVRQINLEDEAKSAIIETLGQLTAQMQFLRGLKPKERQRLAKMGDRSRSFVEEAVTTALANPGLVPRSVDLNQLAGMRRTHANLSEVGTAVAKLQELLSDTTMALGSELYGVTRAVYAVMKTPATVPGLTHRKQRLAQRFSRKKDRQLSETQVDAG